MDLRHARRPFDLLTAGIGLGIGEIEVDTLVKQHRILRDDADLAPQALLGHLADILSIDQNAPPLDVVEAKQQPRQ